MRLLRTWPGVVLRFDVLALAQLYICFLVVKKDYVALPKVLELSKFYSGLELA